MVGTQLKRVQLFSYLLLLGMSLGFLWSFTMIAIHGSAQYSTVLSNEEVEREIAAIPESIRYTYIFKKYIDTG